jgi:hypothetical protein
MMSSDRWMDAGLGLACAVAIATAAWLTPAPGGLATPDGHRTPEACWFRLVTGLPCPTCGMTRSYVKLLKGDISGSVRAHPAGPLMLAATAAALLGILGVGLRRRRPLWGRPGFRFAVTWVALLVLVTGLARYFVT